MYLVFALVLSFPVFLALGDSRAEASSSKIRGFVGNIDNGRRIELLYVESTKKLGVLIKDENGENLSGYIINDVSNPEGSFELSAADRKFGAESTIFRSITVASMTEKTVVANIDDRQPMSMNEVALNDPVFGECTQACIGPSSTWGTCFYCCLVSTDC